MLTERVHRWRKLIQLGIILDEQSNWGAHIYTQQIKLRSTAGNFYIYESCCDIILMKINVYINIFSMTSFKLSDKLCNA